MSPPRFAEWLLASLTPDALRDEALDDLADLHALRTSATGRRAADLWYWRQLPGFLVRIRIASLVGGPLAPPPLTHPRHEKRMRSFLSDLRHSTRGLLRTPVFTGIAVLTMALGIGAAASIFSVVQSVLLRPLPFPDPERVVAVWETRVERDMNQISFTYANFFDVKDMNRSFSDIGAIRWRNMNLTGNDGEPASLSVANTTVGFFRALGVRPIRGRLFADGEDETGRDPRIAVLSNAFWRTRFGSDSNVTAKTITLNGETYQVIGVLPAGTPWLDAADLFTPFIRPATLNRDSWELPVVARLAPGVSRAAAASDLQRIAARLAEQYPEAKGIGFALEESERWIASDSLRRALWVLVGAVGLLLLIACVNLANMLLARATSRVRERAMRAALGASRGRVIQLALAESAVLGVLGAAIGLAIAFGVVSLLRGLNPGDIPRLADTRVDGLVLLVAMGTALFTSLLTGLVPAFRAPHGDVVSALREGDRGVAGHRRGGHIRHTLVAVEVALSLILLVGAGFLVRSMANVLRVDRGFATENRLMVSVGFRQGRTQEEGTRNGQMLNDFLDRVRATPEVTAAAAVTIRPLSGTGTGMGFGAADRPDATGREIPWAGWRIVTKDYFATLGIPLVEGRDFTPQDRLSAPLKVIISKRIADVLWPGESAIGRQMVLWKGQGQSTGEVIGVARDMRDWELTDDPTYSVYLPVYGASMSPANVIVHSRLPTSTLVPMLRARLAEVDRALPIFDIETLDDQVGDSVAARRFTMMMLAVLAVVALVLALGGIYGVLSYAVSQRRSEMGVRLALGASNRSVLGLVMRQGMTPVLVGLAAGTVGAFVLTRLMRTLLYGMTPSDWATYASVAGLMAAAAVIACYIPARDAMRVDVTTTLRED